MMLLDEPTNHLDIEAIDSLAEAIKGFKVGSRAGWWCGVPWLKEGSWVLWHFSRWARGVCSWKRSSVLQLASMHMGQAQPPGMHFVLIPDNM